MLLFRRSRWLNGDFFISHHSLKYLSVSSSNPSEASKPLIYNIMVDFLINSLGFTKEAAITTSSKNIDCTGRTGISSLMKYSSAIRQLAYDNVSDALDEYLQWVQ
ncbi:hypothetical protein Tco_0717349 [Tanacetum coccineum]